MPLPNKENEVEEVNVDEVIQRIESLEEKMGQNEKTRADLSQLQSDVRDLGESFDELAKRIGAILSQSA